MPPHASGMPRSTSGIEKYASLAAIRRSHAAASTTPPPMQWPWMRATVTADIASTASAISRPRSALSRGVRSVEAAAAPASNAPRSAPAENERPLPDTTTTLMAGWRSNHRAASAISASVVDESGLSLSGRLSVSAPRAPAPTTSIVVNSPIAKPFDRRVAHCGASSLARVVTERFVDELERPRDLVAHESLLKMRHELVDGDFTIAVAPSRARAVRGRRRGCRRRSTRAHVDARRSQLRPRRDRCWLRRRGSDRCDGR